MADNPSANKPESGTYGEATDLANLKKALPQGRPVVGQPEQNLPPVGNQPAFPAPEAPGRPSTGAAVPPGIPSVILHPTSRPDVPMTGTAGPVQQDPYAGAVAPDQRRLALLQLLAQNPDVSSATRAWAQEVLSVLVGGQGVQLGG